MKPAALDRFEWLGRSPAWAAVAVLLLSVVGAIAVATSNTTLPFAEDIQRQGRALIAIATLAGGLPARGSSPGSARSSR